MDTADRDLIEEMLHHATLAIGFLGTQQQTELQSDQKAYLAIRHALGIVGEAANQVSASTRAELPNVPWRDIISMRHRLYHGYRYVEADIIVSTVRGHLPDLVRELEGALKDGDR
jgi:uncharacterized protein with HEPN domain